MAYNSSVTAADVKEIFDTGLSDSSILTWLAVAEERVGELPSHNSLDDARKDQIVTFLTAAFATAQDPRVDRESHESATVSYGGERMAYIDVAVMLDPTDVLAADEGNEPSVVIPEVLPDPSEDN